MKMGKYDSAVLSHEELTEEAIRKYGIDVKEDFERIAKDCCEPQEWVPIEETNLLIGITLSGGAIKCCRCQCSWSLNYHWIGLPQHVGEGDVSDITTITNTWQEKKKWWECPCCEYEADGS